MVPWSKTISAVCERGEQALKWGFPEPWFQTETFVALDAAAESTGWRPLPMEVPYITFGPVTLPKPSNRDWTTQGAVKWVDLCMRSEDGQAWCWVEFKISQSDANGRAEKAALNARDAVRKDVVALMALDVQRTADAWTSPDQHTKAYWFEETLTPLSDEVRQGRHSFAVVYLQLGGEFDQEVWGETAFQEAIREWWAYRTAPVALPIRDRQARTEYEKGLPGGHSALIVWGRL